jgi:hypothetical protein
MPPPPFLYLEAKDAYIPPRADGFNADKPLESYKLDAVQAKREQFMLCHLIRLINEALRYLKEQACVGDDSVVKANMSETYSVYASPTDY